MAVLFDPDWRDKISFIGAALYNLPNRPSGYLPEIQNTGEGWTIRDYPRPMFALRFRSKEAAVAVAVAFYSKTKYTKEAFMKVLSSEHLARIVGADDPDEVLISIARNYYLSVYEGVGDWSVTPNEGRPGAEFDFLALWRGLPTRVMDTLLDGRPRAADSEPVPTEVVAVDVAVRAVESPLPAVKPVEQSKLLLLL